MSHKSVAAEQFKIAVCRGASCTLGGSPKNGCSGPLEAHHLVPAQRIRAHVATMPEEDRLRAVYDPRIAIPLCSKHHHEITHGFRAFFYEDLPPAAFEYAREWRLEWSIDRDYPSLEDLRGVV